MSTIGDILDLMVFPFTRWISAVSPLNLDKNEIRLSRKLLGNPFRWRTGKEIVKLEERFAKRFGGVGAVGFGSGRAALWGILKALAVGEGDEVLMSPFARMGVLDAVLGVGAAPVYVDVRDDFNVDPAAIEKVITARTKLMIVQYKFGITVEIDKVMAIAMKHRLVVVEDCMETASGVYKKGLFGSWAPISFFALGSSDSLSGFGGGVVVTKDLEFMKKLRDVRSTLGYPRRGSIFRRLMLWSVNQRSGLEKMRDGNVFRMTNVEAAFGLMALGGLERLNKRRAELAIYYHRHLGNILGIKTPVDLTNPLVGFPLRLGAPDRLRRYAKGKGLKLGDGYNTVMYLDSSGMRKANYKIGQCPNAEKLAREVVTLPLFPGLTPKQAGRVVGIVTEYLKKSEN